MNTNPKAHATPNVLPDPIADEDEGSVPRAERILGTLLVLVLRLWCLPFALVGWLLAWTLIVLIRGAGMLSDAAQMPRKWLNGVYSS